jgi:hypothetical protein
MLDRLTKHTRRGTWLSALIALIAIAGQLTVALAPLAEGREGRMASHVEANGSRAHFVHDEAKCVSCQARSMHSAPERDVVPPIVLEIAAGVVVDAVASAQSADLNHQSNPRAPPSLI